MSRIPILTGVVLSVSITLALAAAAQQAARPPVVRPAPEPDVPAEHVAPAPIVVPAEQVAPVELTGLLGHAVVDSGDMNSRASSICWPTGKAGCVQLWWTSVASWAWVTVR